MEESGDTKIIDISKERVISSSEADELFEFVMNLTLTEARFVKTWITNLRNRSSR